MLQSTLFTLNIVRLSLKKKIIINIPIGNFDGDLLECQICVKLGVNF
jgi:hypothetical protein